MACLRARRVGKDCGLVYEQVEERPSSQSSGHVKYAGGNQYIATATDSVLVAGGPESLRLPLINTTLASTRRHPAMV